VQSECEVEQQESETKEELPYKEPEVTAKQELEKQEECTSTHGN
jgi:hypothetical protein